MTVASASPEDEIVYLKHQLAVAETRLERAESFVFDLRCLAAKKSGRALWMREGDGSGLRGAHEGSAGLGGWKELNAESLPTPTRTPPLVLNLLAELGFPLPPFGPIPSFTKDFPLELFYHMAEQSSPGTLLNLCAVSSLRAIASPILYHSMDITNASQLRSFLPKPTFPLAPLNRSLTLDKVISLSLVVPYGCLAFQDDLSQHYSPIRLPQLLHLTLEPQYRNENAPTLFADFLLLARFLLASLNPQTLTILPGLNQPSRQSSWREYRIHPAPWQAIGPNWTRLSLLRFVDCSVFVDNEDDTCSFLPGVQSSSISFVWSFSAGVYHDVIEEGGTVLGVLQNFGVFEHPSVQAHGIKLVVGDGEEDRAALKKDLEEELDDENVPLVRYR